MSQYEYKRIADSVHGTIGLSETETDLISTRAFQRLRNVKQLGLADLVFPGADYSRLSHCIGVCHVTGRILDTIKASSKKELSEYDHQRYRLAGLLHDVGHLPFSHAFEKAVQDYYGNRQAASVIVDDNAPTPVKGTQDQTSSDGLGHEAIGRLLLDNDDQIIKILQKQGISPSDVHSIFTRDKQQEFANLISSDLDADRIDYLLRTAKHTGLPYGTIDIDYIISQMRLDNESRICLTPKALRTAEHFLLGRYFDYQQVSFHKTVAAFEMVLRDIVVELLSRRMIDCSRIGIESRVQSGLWSEFDEAFVLTKIRKLREKHGNENEVLQAKINSLLRRSPPKLIGGIEYWEDRNKKDEEEELFRVVRRIRQSKEELAAKFDIDSELWFVWDNGGMPLTKFGPSLPMQDPSDYEDKLAQAVRIKDGVNSKPIFEVPTSLMGELWDKSLHSARLYVILPEENDNLRREITTSARKAIDHRYWFDGKQWPQSD